MITLKNLSKNLSRLAKNPLSLPIVLLVCATKFVAAPIEALIIYASLGVIALLYAIWVINREDK